MWFIYWFILIYSDLSGFNGHDHGTSRTQNMIRFALWENRRAIPRSHQWENLDGGIILSARPWPLGLSESELDLEFQSVSIFCQCRYSRFSTSRYSRCSRSAAPLFLMLHSSFQDAWTPLNSTWSPIFWHDQENIITKNESNSWIEFSEDHLIILDIQWYKPSTIEISHDFTMKNGPLGGLDLGAAGHPLRRGAAPGLASLGAGSSARGFWGETWGETWIFIGYSGDIWYIINYSSLINYWYIYIHT